MLKQLFFDYDQSGRRCHSKKLFKRRSRLKKLLPVRVGLVEKSIFTSPDVVRVLSIIALIQYYTASWVG